MVIAVLAQALALADLIDRQEVPDTAPAIFNGHHRRVAKPVLGRQDVSGRPGGRRNPQANQAPPQPRCALDSPSSEDGAAKIARNLREAARNAPCTAELSKQSLPHMLAMVSKSVPLAKNPARGGTAAHAQHRSGMPGPAGGNPASRVRRPLSVVDTPAGTQVAGAHTVDLQCGLQFVTCFNPPVAEASAMHGLLVHQHAGLVVDLTATGLARRGSARPLKYAPPVGAKAVTADGRLQVSCISGKWLPKGGVHRKELRLTPRPGTDQQECAVTRLHAKDLGALERIKPKQLIALADAVEDNCADPRRPIVIHADGSSDKPALLMDFLAARRHIDARVARQNAPCNPQMLMTVLAEVLAAGAGSLDPARLTEPYLALLVQTLQQSFDPKNRRTRGKRIQIDAPPQPPSRFTAAPPLAGGDGAPQSGFENAAASDTEASAAQVAAARAYFLRLARQGAIQPAPIPGLPHAAAGVLPAAPAAPAAPLQYSLIDDLTGSQPTVPMPVMEWTLPAPLPVPVRLPDAAAAAAVRVPES